MPRLDPEDPSVESAVFGKEVQIFLNSKIGDYLLRRSQAEVEGALVGLRAVDPHDWAKVQAFQNQLKVAESFQAWLGDAVAEGMQAIKLLEEEHAGT